MSEYYGARPGEQTAPSQRYLDIVEEYRQQIIQLVKANGGNPIRDESGLITDVERYAADVSGRYLRKQSDGDIEELHYRSKLARPEALEEGITRMPAPLVQNVAAFKDVDVAKSYMCRFKSPNTIKSMRNQVELAARTLLEREDAGISDFPWQTLTPAIITNALQKLEEKGKSNNTVQITRVTFHGLAREAYRLGLMSAETCRNILNLKGKHAATTSRPQPVSTDVTVRLLNYLRSKKNNRSTRNAAILALLAGCGLKRSEIVAINNEDIDFEEKSIRLVLRTKGVTTVYMSNSVFRYIKAWAKHRDMNLPKQAFFARFSSSGEPSDKRMSPEAIFYIVEEIRKELGIVEKFSPEDFRSAFRETIKDKVRDADAVRQQLGLRTRANAKPNKRTLKVSKHVELVRKTTAK